MRLCLCCNSQHVEDEFHFIMECPVYENLRSILFQDIEIVNVSFYHILSDVERAFVYLMSSAHRDIINALGVFVWEAFNCYV